MPSNHLSSPSPLAFNCSQKQGLFHESILHISGHNIGTSASASVLPMNIQDLSPLGLVMLISLLFRKLSRLLPCHSSKALILWHSVFFMVQLTHPYVTTGKTIIFTRWTFVSKVMSLIFNMLSRLAITFLPRSKCPLMLCLQLPSAVVLESKKIKSVTVSTVFPSTRHEVMGPDAMILVFWMLSFKPAYSLSSFTFIKRLFNSLSLSAIRVVSSAYLRLLIFPLGILIPACALSSAAFRCILHTS